MVAFALALAAPLHFADDSTRARAALTGLERRYGAGGELQPVYIEGSWRTLSGLTAIGHQPVEIVSRGELSARYAGQEAAPTLTTVSVDEQHGGLGLRYTVTVTSFGFPLPGATRVPWGGTHIYYFRQWCGLLWADGEDFIAH